MFSKNKIQTFSSLLFILTLLLSSVHAPAVSAQSRDGLKRQINVKSGKVSFISPERGQTLPAAKALGTFIRPQDPGMALAKRFAPEFGIKNPERELTEIKKHDSSDGRVTVRYLQKYEGIPVMGGELIVNTNERGDLYSMSGEVSSGLTLQTQPKIDSAQAAETARQALAKWYEKSPADFNVSEPELWIFDESLLKPSTRPVELVWRMEVTPTELGLPVRELVLVNAERGNISLHFNQIDMAWGEAQEKAAQVSNTASSNSISVHQQSNGESTVANLAVELTPALSGGVTWYVSTTGNNANDCLTTSTPCATVQGAVDKAGSGDIIKVATGTYSPEGPSGWYAMINKSLILSGGWDNNYAVQTDFSIVDLQNASRGVYIYNSVETPTVILDRFSIRNGYTFYLGSGIVVQGSIVTINNSSILDNIGVGINTYNSTLSINNTTVDGNIAGRGGGMYVDGGTLNLNNSAIINNHANIEGGGLYSTNINTINVRNTILANNTTDSLGPDCYKNGPYGGISILDHSIVSNNAHCPMPTGSGNLINIDPGTLVKNSQGYYYFLATSPAIDAGDNNTCTSTDQRGAVRPYNGICDIGAFERQGGGTDPASIVVYQGAAQTAAINNTFPSDLEAFLLDTHGDGVSGKTVTFTAPASGASATFASTGTNISTSITDAGGFAIASTVSANNLVGVFTVQATINGLAESADFQLTNYDPALPTSITIYSGSDQMAPPQKQFFLPLKAIVRNHLGVPLSGITVIFTAPANGATGSFADTSNNVTTAVTNLDGIATSAAFSANNVEGGYIVHATVNGLAGSADFLLSNIPQQILTYTADNSTFLPGNFLCDQSDPTCTFGDAHAKAAHKYAIGTYALYQTAHNRNGIDQNNLPVISSVHYCSPSSCPYANAFWSGTQMVFGDAYGYALADDVVAHEFTHGVTQYESNLFYYYQSGAINESFSDVWGEYYDQTNGLGNDAAGVKWLHGEDISGRGASRSMSNPPAYGDPDKMTSLNYYLGEGDSGGVHSNSGINNKAAYLLVDGGAFNGRTVTALGWEKVGAMYYEANTNLLTSAADYSDLYYAVQQACLNLLGQHGITAGDCVEVKDAVDAVEMNGQPAPGFNSDAPVCSAAGTFPSFTFVDDLESGSGNWTFNNGAFTRWQVDSSYYGTYAHSGLHSLYADDYPDTVTDATAQLNAMVIPGNAYLHFAQAYSFEYGEDYYDGGVLEYSTNGGASWLDAGSLMDSNGYKGVISSEWGNPLAGRSAFAGVSHGYISTRLNLSSLAGQTVTFRWRMGLDVAIEAGGWWVDDVRIYTCVAGRTISGNVGAAGIPLSFVDGVPKVVNSDGSGNYSISVPNGWSGTVIPAYPCYLFTPPNLPYNNVVSNLTGQNYTAVVDPTACAAVDVKIAGLLKGSYTIPNGGRVTPLYPGINTGPVQVVSNNTVPIITSERAYRGPNYTDWNEMLGFPADQLTTEYWFPLYDTTGIAKTFLSIGNTSPSTTAEVSVYIAGNLMSSYTIPVGGRVTPIYDGINNGPVQVVSTNGVPIIVSERAYRGPNYTDWNEMLGFPADQLTTEYWFPLCDGTGTAQTFISIGNASPSTAAEVTVKIAGQVLGNYTIPVGGRVTPNCAGLNNGPVQVYSTNGTDIIVSERAYRGPNYTDWNEMLGLPVEQLTTEYWFPLCDGTGTSQTFLSIGNASQSTAQVSVKIAGQLFGSYTIPVGGRVTPMCAGINNGPVQVYSTNGTNIIVSERAYRGANYTDWNEMLGLPVEQLTTEYWFPLYDTTGTAQTFLTIGNAQ